MMLGRDDMTERLRLKLIEVEALKDSWELSMVLGLLRRAKKAPSTGATHETLFGKHFKQ